MVTADFHSGTGCRVTWVTPYLPPVILYPSQVQCTVEFKSNRHPSVTVTCLTNCCIHQFAGWPVTGQIFCQSGRQVPQCRAEWIFQSFSCDTRSSSYFQLIPPFPNSHLSAI